MLGCAVPHRPLSGCPLISAEEARLLKVATWQSLRATSIRCPLPVLARPSRAARIEFEVYKPAVRSVTATPTFTGGPVPRASDVHEPHLGLNHDIVARTLPTRPCLAVASDGGIDEARVQGAEGGIVQTIL